MSYLMFNKKKGVSAMELMLVVALIGILIAIAVPNYAKIKEDIKKKACLANMGTIHNATRLFYMENPIKDNNFKGVSVDDLFKQNYLKSEPRCPNASASQKSDAFYSVVDKPGKPIDVVCVNVADSKLAHGSYNAMTKQPGASGNQANQSAPQTGGTNAPETPQTPAPQNQ